MAKTSYEKALEKQIKEAKKQAEEAALRDRASARVNGQQVVNGFHVLESSTEETLQGILQCYDGNESFRVSGNYEIFPEYVQRSIKLEFEILRMCGMIVSPQLYLDGVWHVYLTPQGKNYFCAKEDALSEKGGAPGLATATRKKYDVFISHANKDKLDYVDELFVTLRRLGINIFYDSEVLSWGDNWKQVILDGTAQSEFAIIVISNQFFGREWAERELNEFLQQQNENGQKIILPLLHGISFDELKTHYPELEYIQSLKTSDHSKDAIAIFLAKELIKRYR